MPLYRPAVERHLQRLYRAMHEVLLEQSLIQGDKTTVQVLSEYQAWRGQQHPQAFLRGNTRTLMTDDYSAWRVGVLHLGCSPTRGVTLMRRPRRRGKAHGRVRQALDLIGKRPVSPPSIEA